MFKKSIIRQKFMGGRGMTHHKKNLSKTCLMINENFSLKTIIEKYIILL